MNVQIDPFYPVGENIDLESLSNRWGKSIEETVFITTALSIDVFSPFAYLVDVEIKDCQELLFTVDYDPAKSHCGFEWPRLIPLGVKGDVVEFTGMNRLNREFIQEGKGLAFPKQGRMDQFAHSCSKPPSFFNPVHHWWLGLHPVNRPTQIEYT
ncbi:hypothetical protein THIOSC15_2840004 [uncultured Thiomicrorhabdus sp.]